MKPPDRPSHLFYFIVRHLRLLAKIPLLPQIFDGFLSAWISLFHRERLAAIEMLEERAAQFPGVRTRVHRFGGIEFYHERLGELGHIHGHGLFDVRLKRATARTLVRKRQVRPHHVFPDSRWISLLLKTRSDADFAISLLKLAISDQNLPQETSTSPTAPP